MAKPPHPGRTPAERRVLDAIGVGDFTPRMSPALRQRMLDAGLIHKVGVKVFGRDRFGAITVPEYGMPIPVHMAWCAAVSYGVKEEDLE